LIPIIECVFNPAATLAGGKEHVKDAAARLEGRWPIKRIFMSNLSINDLNSPVNPVPDAAIALAEQGFRVFPCRSGAKRPATPNGFEDATQNKCEVSRLFTNRNYNLAIATGHDGLFVLDFDEPDGLQKFEQANSPLPATVQARTPRGGRHVYLRAPTGVTIRNSTGKLAEKIDVRGIGGYVVACPSLVNGRRYNWIEGHAPGQIDIASAPDWLISLLTSPSRGPEPTTELQPTRLDSAAPETLRPAGNAPDVDWYGRCQRYLEQVPASISGQRGHDAMLRACCEAYRFGLDDSAARQLAVWFNANKCSPPWSERELEHKLCDAKKLVDEMGEFGMRRNKPDTQVQTLADQRNSARIELTDVGNARRLVRLHRDKIRHVSGIGWYVWDGIRWRLDDTLEIYRLAKETVQAMLEDSAKVVDDAQRRALAKHALASESAVRLRAMVDMAASEPGIAIRAEELDADSWLLNVKNGIIDLRDGTLHPHDPAKLLTKLAPVNYDPAATCPRFDQFLTEIFGVGNELPQYVARLFGMCLTGDTREQILPILWGEGQNGKSTLVGVIMHIMGDYAGLAAESLLMVGRHEEHPCGLADMQGKRIVVASETESAGRLKMQLIKRLTGDETIKARRMRENYYEFPRTHKTILQTNNKPRINENSKAVWRRVKLIPFNVIIPDDKKDPELLRKLKAEASGILNCLIGGCLDWQRHGLGEPPEVMQATDAYREESDPLREFLEERCVETPGAWTATGELYTAYTRWCEASGERPVRKNQFGEAMVRSGFEAERRNAGRGWKGIALR
jgi:putative DNA primase/helicase